MHGTIGMLNRKGRKRKSGRRTSSGALARPKVDYRAMAAAQPHRNWLPEALRLSERAGTMLGCLLLTRHISEEQYEAGRRYSVIVGAYHAVASVPGGTSGAGRGYDCPGSSDCDPCQCRQRTENYMRAYEAISRSAGRKAHFAINRVLWDKPVSEDQLIHLKWGLDALAEHFGLTNRRKS